MASSDQQSREQNVPVGMQEEASTGPLAAVKLHTQGNTSPNTEPTQSEEASEPDGSGPAPGTKAKTDLDRTPSQDSSTGKEPQSSSQSSSEKPSRHAHSVSLVPTTSTLKVAKSPRKAMSTTQLSAAADKSVGSRIPSSFSNNDVEDRDLVTLPDPRKSAPVSPLRFDPGPTDEVTALSAKLIDAINHQTALDDSLSQTRLELEASRGKVRSLEEMAARQKEFLAGGVWVRKSAVEQEKAQLLAKAKEEKRLRLEAEQARRKMELELETLTAELFQQANTMVAVAKEEAQKEQLAAARRYELLKSHLADTEGLLKSQQDQLSELKQVMEGMIEAGSLPRDDETVLTTPTTPGFGHSDVKDSDSSSSETPGGGTSQGPDDVPRLTDDGTAARNSISASAASTSAQISTASDARTASARNSVIASPTHLAPALEPAALPHLVGITQSFPLALRYDTAAYGEFIDLIRSSQIQIWLQQQQQHQYQLQTHSRSPSSTSLPKTPPLGSMNWSAAAAAGTTAFPVTASLSGTAAVNGSFPHQQARDLKEAKFYKRVLTEDIEPTLRLDIAPGISWLARRSIMAAILEGSLVVEPVVPPSDGASSMVRNACAMCGESRPQETYLRQHRFRLTESDKSTPYPLCGYCLGRVRSVCDSLVFLRMIKDGHWRADDEEAERSAWDECVRLREHMFWARIGAAALPASSTVSSFPSRHTRLAAGGSGNHDRPGLSSKEHATIPANEHHPHSSALSNPSPTGLVSDLGIVSDQNGHGRKASDNTGPNMR